MRRLLLVLLLLLLQAPPSAFAEEGTPPEEKGEVSAPSQEAVEREQGAGEDPLAQKQAERVEEPSLWSSEPNELSP